MYTMRHFTRGTLECRVGTEGVEKQRPGVVDGSRCLLGLLLSASDPCLCSQPTVAIPTSVSSASASSPVLRNSEFNVHPRISAWLPEGQGSPSLGAQRNCIFTPYLSTVQNSIQVPGTPPDSSTHTPHQRPGSCWFCLQIISSMYRLFPLPSDSLLLCLNF